MKLQSLGPIKWDPNDIIHRGQIIDTGEWVIGYLLRAPGVYTIIAQFEVINGEVFDSYFRVDPNSVSPYTFMSDKNGTPIFAGDILVGEKVDTCITRYEYGNGINSIPVKNTVRYTVEFTPNGLQLTDYYRTFCEIVGNVYDMKCDGKDT